VSAFFQVTVVPRSTVMVLGEKAMFAMTTVFGGRGRGIVGGGGSIAPSRGQEHGGDDHVGDAQRESVHGDPSFQ
jgi:hypothetical protein